MREYKHPMREATQCRWVHVLGGDGFRRGAYAFCPNAREGRQSYCTEHMNRSRVSGTAMDKAEVLKYAGAV